ncbi:unnamed protein product [Staurois parvus]|uniref:Uncharacterized protein n=1 Tax=Staurois parvus TaxID=386267 RepID=A0ABN9B2U9_9NEOB|nr:unnamed protein product [Staurois parvus]
MCHFQVSFTTAGGFHFCHRVLADYGPPIAAARPVICPWAPVPPHHAAARPRVSVMGPCTAPIAAVSNRPHSAMCHFQVSSHCWWVSIFCHRVLYGLSIAAASTATLWLHTLVFGPVNCPNVVKCAVILRSTASSCMSLLTDSYYFSSPADSKGI